jgi:hypothetical protein
MPTLAEPTWEFSMMTVSPPLTLHSWQGRRVLALLCAVTFPGFVDASITNVTKVGSRAMICAGALIAATGLFLLGQVPVGGGYPAHILPGLLLVAFGAGPVFVGVTAAANAGVGRAEPDSRQPSSTPPSNSVPSSVSPSSPRSDRSGSPPARARHSRADATTSGIRHALVTGAAFAAAAALTALATTNTP